MSAKRKCGDVETSAAEKKQKAADASPWKHGFAAAQVPGITSTETATFARELRTCTQAWFERHLGAEATTRLKEHIDFNDNAKLANLLNSKWRKANLSEDDNKLVRAAFDGNMNAQFHPFAGWRKSGFGIFCHLFGLKFLYQRLLPAALPVLRDLLQHEMAFSKLPHVIFKPPSETDGKLAFHQDSTSFEENSKACIAYIRQGVNTFEQWVVDHGYQSLLHIEGAREGAKGHTQTISNLTPKRYLLMMYLLHPDHVHADMPKLPGKETHKAKWTANGKPIFYPWEKTVPVINRLFRVFELHQPPTLASDLAWVAAIKKSERIGDLEHKAALSDCLPAAVVNIVPPDCEGPYLAMWGRGLLHCADKTGMVPRLSVTVPSIVKEKLPLVQTRLDVHLQRLEALTTRDWDTISAMKEPLSGGMVHKQPWRERSLFSDFASMYVASTAEWKPAFA